MASLPPHLRAPRVPTSPIPWPTTYPLRNRDGSLTQLNSVIIFDWDDTLLPSTWLAVNKISLDVDTVPERVREVLAPVEASAKKLLSRAKSISDVLIITNAEAGWVELSAAKFLPGLVPTLKGVIVQSARTMYGGEFPDEPARWKQRAFAFEVHRHVKAGANNIVSLGDSDHERDALAVATHDAPVIPKSVKFVERPTAALLARQIDMVIANFEHIVHERKSLDLMLTGSTPATPAEAGL